MLKGMLAASFAFALVATPALAKEQGNATVGGGHMQHCPTAVEGAKTEIKDGKDGVEISVTAANAAKTEEIRKRAKHVADAAKNDPAAVAHTGDGHGGGGLGRCEVVLKDTTVTSEDIEGGSKLTVKPTKAVDLEWLRKETAARHAANGGKKPAAVKKAAAEPAK
jgi:hypothetical protein